MVDTPHAEAETIVVTLPDEIDMANACRVGEDWTPPLALASES